MKITIVLGAFLPVPPIMGGAVEKAWFELGKEFVRRGHDVVQISRAVAELPETQTIDGVNHVRVRGFDTPRSIAWLKLLDLVYSARARRVVPAADVLVTNTFWLPILARRNAGRVYVHVARRPKGQMRLYKGAARLQAPSQTVADDIKAEVPAMESRVRVIPYPRPGAAGSAEPPPLADRDRTVLFVGRVDPEKGVHLLVRAFLALCRQKFAGWKLIIVGPHEPRYGGGGAQYLDELRTLADSDPRVQFPGAIFDSAELAREYDGARLFVYPSLAEKGETFGLAALEAMGRRCAVLTSGLGCFSDFVTDGTSGFVFDHRAADPVAALQQRLDDVMSDEGELARVAETGYRKSNEYAIELVAQQFLDDFQHVLEARNG
ncbi:MAG: glycosyltransferase family 4 protein [Chthoniobacterales bacterium]